MERDYKDEVRQAHDYIRKLKSEEWYERPLADDEYTPALEKFEAIVLEYEGLWNTCNWGYTLEFSTGKGDFEKKAEILSRSSHRLKRGAWRTMRCSTCKGYDEETPIHVDIDHSMDWEDQHKHALSDYKRMNLLRERIPKGTARFNVETLKAVLATLPETSDLAIELSLAIDESVEAQSHIEYYE